MRSVLISPSWPVERAQNGIVTYVSRIAEPLRDQGIDVQVVAHYVDEDLREEAKQQGIAVAGLERATPLHYLRNKLWRRLDATAADTFHQAWRLTRTLRRLHRKRPIDTYEIEEAFGDGRILVGRAPGRQVVRLHGPWFLCVPALGLDRNALENIKRIEWEGECIRGADAVSSPSKHALDEVRRRYECSLSRAAVIPNATPLVDRVWSREEAKPRSILFVGRFDRLKGADTVIEAFGRVHARHPDATLTFVGPDRGLPDGTGIEAFIDRTLPAAAQENLRWLGARPPSEIEELRPAHAVTVIASRFETFGMTVIEAMAAGSPVLGADGGAIPEVLEWADELVFEAGNSKALAAKLDWLFDEVEVAEKLGARGREVCRDRYSPQAVAKATAALHRATRKR